MGEKKEPKHDHIKVVVRSRPLNEAEKATKTPILVSCDASTRSVKVDTTLGGKRSKNYHFDMVFGQYSTQQEVYTAAIQPIVTEVLQGFNCTVFAYGQTGTGKTHTMEGVIDDEELMGVIPRAVTSIFQKLEDDKNPSEYSAKCSFLELYNEELSDLLSDNDEKKVRVVEDRSQKSGTSVSCHNLEEVLVKGTADVLKNMRKAMSKRQVAATKLNKASSRSHCIFSLTVHIKETTPEGEDLLKIGKLNLVDLAGSESVGRSGAKDARAREAGNINRSLLTLGRVISALVERTPHIPYRDSKLTRLLQESLGGKAKTCIIATVAPSVQCIEETISTLDYASRAKSIKNKPEANQKMTKRALIREYAEDIDRLRRELQAARAKDGVYLNEDQYNDMVQGLESKTKQLGELEATLEMKQERLKELTDIFKTTSLELENTKTELGETKSKLTATELDLGGTKIELKDEKTRVKEHRVIIDAHQKTERSLTEQAKTLQRTIDTVVEDTGLLHAKISRKDELEQTHLATGKEYQDSTLATLANLKQQAGSFCDEQIRTLNNFSEQLTSLRSNRKNENSKLLEIVSLLSFEIKKSTEEIADINKNNAEGLFNDNSNGLMDKIMSENTEALLKTQANISGLLCEVIPKILAESETRHIKWEQDMTCTITQSRNSLSDFNDRLAKEMEELDSLIQSQNLSHVENLNQNMSTLESFLDSEKRRSDEAVESLKSSFADLITNFNQKNKEQLEAAIMKSKASSTGLIEEIRKDQELSLSKVREVVDFSKESCASHTKNISIVEGLWTDVYKSNMGDIENVRSKALNAESVLQDHMASASARDERQAKSLRAYVESTSNSIEKQNDEIKEIVQDKNSAVVNQCEDSNMKVESLVNESAQMLAVFKENIIANQNNQEQSIETMESECGQLMGEKILPYVSTGETPSKKTYPYTLEIPVTSPEKNILYRYRNQGIPTSPMAIGPSDRRARSASSPTCPTPVRKSSEQSYDSGKKVGDEDKCEASEVGARQEEKEQVESKMKSEETGFAEPLRMKRSNSNSSNPRLKYRQPREQSEPPSRRSDKSRNNIDRESSENQAYNANRKTLTKKLSAEKIDEMKVKELRQELSLRNCPQFGTKNILQQRLRECIRKEEE